MYEDGHLSNHVHLNIQIKITCCYYKYNDDDEHDEHSQDCSNPLVVNDSHNGWPLVVNDSHNGWGN